MPTFNYLTYGVAKSEVALRLNDPAMLRWTSAELGLYINEALQLWNCLTQFWAQDYAVTLTPPFSSNWFSTNIAGSPRLQSSTDANVYTLMEYHLLEPPTGGTWSGTSQYGIADLAQAVQRRRDEILQNSACNLFELSQECPPNTNRMILVDSVLDVRRVRYFPDSTLGSPATLSRGDGLSFMRFTPAYQQTTSSPLRWDVLAGPPLSLTFDAMIPVPNFMQVLLMLCGNTLIPPTTSPLQVPNDWAWVVKFGAMADVLSTESEGKDQQRADYCRKRYLEGMKLMVTMPWLLEAFLNGVPADTPAVASSDRFNWEWQSRANAFPGVVVGGIDLYAVSPTPLVSTSVRMVLVGNALLPVADGDPVQVPRDVMDAILDEAQHLAMFKSGGAEFMQSLSLHQAFIQTAMRANARLRESGIFATDLRPAVPKQDEQQPRFANSGGE